MSVAQRDGDQHALMVPRLTAHWVTELNEARARHEAEFWSTWWTSRPTTADELRQALAHVKVGEEMRIPAGDEELVIERRAAGPLVTEQRAAGPLATEQRAAGQPAAIVRLPDDPPVAVASPDDDRRVPVGNLSGPPPM
jgi:hypothetical protein